MLARTAYEQAKSDIEESAKIYTNQLKFEMQGFKNLQKAITTAGKITKEYSKNYVTLTFTHLRTLGYDVVDRIAPEFTNEEKEILIANGIEYLNSTRYYGLTLPQRLRHSSFILQTKVKRSAVVGKDTGTRLNNITCVLDSTYPFGAHKNWDIRLFLAESVRLEHFLAKEVAKKKEEKLLRWTLSGNHTHIDMCDEYAHSVHPEVENLNLNIDAKGVYFIDDIPDPPHPNCQCSLLSVKERKLPKSKPKPTLIKRIIRAIFH